MEEDQHCQITRRCDLGANTHLLAWGTMASRISGLPLSCDKQGCPQYKHASEPEKSVRQSLNTHGFVLDKSWLWLYPRTKTPFGQVFVLDKMYNTHLTIAAVERETGLAKDTLRVWERRYGFPAPERDGCGERLYPAEQVDKLRLLRRLTDQGLRPAKLVGLDSEALRQLLEEKGRAQACACPDACRRLDTLLTLIRTRAHYELRQQLQQALMKVGLQQFVCGVVAPLSQMVGDAWLRGELGVSEEHLYTETVQNLLRTAISSQPSQGCQPRVVLTTFPEEFHSLGLLMVEAMLVTEGACCLSLGVHMPLDEIRQAAEHGPFDVLALSFSAAYPARQAVEGLRSLRQQLPPRLAIWAGGAGLNEVACRLGGIQVFRRLEEIGPALAHWREADGAKPQA